MAALEARLRKLEEVAFQREVDRVMAQSEPILQAYEFSSSER